MTTGSHLLQRAGTTAAGLGGQALALATRVVSVRPAAKPLHPRGTVLTGRVERYGGWDTGAAWLDEPGAHDALVRISAAVGLPRGLPDVHGLAVRAVLADGAAGDQLLATTGSGPHSRYLLVPGMHPDRMFFGSLLPYRSPGGPVLLGATRRPDLAWDLLAAVGGGAWAAYGALTVSALPHAGDDPVSFDPVLHPLPGLAQYDAVRRLRLPAYRTARRTRSD